MTMSQQVNFQEVIEIARKQIGQEGLMAKIQPLGIRGDSARCLLLDSTGKTIACGIGSGGGCCGVANAMLDALDSLLRDRARCEAPIIEADPLVLAEEPAIESEVPLRRLLDARRRNSFSETATKHIPLREYHDLLNGERVRVPLFLSIPESLKNDATPEQGHDAVGDVVQTYSSTAGSGIATSCHEAILRGIDECIERDALALLRVRSLSPSHLGAAPLAVIRREGLPEDLQAMVGSVEADVESRIVLLDLTTDLGIPVVAAVATPLHTRIQYMGLAAGSSPSDVVRAALADLVLAVDTDMPTSDMGIGTLLAMDNVELIEFLTLPGEAKPDYESDLVERLDLLNDSGFRVLVSPTYSCAAGVVAVHVLVPGLERGTGISDGRLLATGDRGRAALDAALGGDHASAWAS